MSGNRNFIGYGISNREILNITKIKEDTLILTCKLGNEIINCYDGTHNKEQLKKWASKKILLCPACGKPYEYCHGEIKTPYFRHMDKNECEDKYFESETEEHLNGKRDLFEWIKKQNGVSNAVLEGWIPETKQRPDIMFKYNENQYVIEYQCSPISSEYIERHELYKASGIIDIWICGSEKYLQKYHNGTGKKRINLLEGKSKIYYDSTDNNFYFVTDELDRISKMNYQKIQCLLCDKVDFMRIPKSYVIFNGNIKVDDNMFCSMNKAIIDFDNCKEKEILSYLDRIKKYYPEFNIKERRKSHTIFIDLHDKAKDNVAIYSIFVNMCYYDNSIQIDENKRFGTRTHTSIKAINYLINSVYENRQEYRNDYLEKKDKENKRNIITTIANKLALYNNIKNYRCNFQSMYYHYGIIFSACHQEFAIFIKYNKVDFCQRTTSGSWWNVKSYKYENEDDIFNFDLFSSIIETFGLTEVKDNE